MNEVVKVLLICLLSCMLFVPTLMIISWVCMIISDIFTFIAKFCMGIIKTICNFKD